MAIKIQLKDVSQSAIDFSGYYLIIFFQKLSSSLPSNPLPASVVLDVNSSGEADFDTSNLADGAVQISIKGPAGDILATKAIDKNLIAGQSTLLLNYSFSKLLLAQSVAAPPGVVNGKLIDSTGTKKLEEIQIIIFASSAPAPDKYVPIQVVNTEAEGYFFFTYPVDSYNSAYAMIGIQSANGKNRIPISFDKDDAGANIFPKRLLLILEPDDNSTITTATKTDCGCNEFDFQNQKRVLDEFSYYSLIRTSDPEIKAYSVEDEEDITLDKILQASPTSSNPIVTGIIADPISVFGHPAFRHPIVASLPATTHELVSEQPLPQVATNPPVNDENIAEQLKNISIKKSVVRDFFDQYKVLNKDTYLNLLQLNDAAKVGNIIKNAAITSLGRTTLNSNNQVDWDNNPTIYQATSIAYGHILHYKQQWVADGYSLGDLVYSLPLAPGQKKQIVVFDWERRESAANTQEINYEESLDNSLSRDRDINEIASGVVNEKLNGSSTSTVKSASAGLGATIGPLVLGASGGVSKSNSSASQDSMRAMAAGDAQSLSDKTIQAANSVRSQRSTVIQTVAQGEKYEVSAESVANYNHCHALTIQYFEVLRHFKIQQKLVDAQECLFVPLPITTFDIDKARRWREILSATLRDKSLIKTFDALQRVKDHWEHSDFPATTFAAENVLNLSGGIKLRIDLICPSDMLTVKTRKVSYPVPGGFGTVNTEDEDYTVAEYDPSQWAWMNELLHINPKDFYDTYIKDQKNRDEIFRGQLGDKIAQQVVENLNFKAVDDAGNNLPVIIDASLSSTFHNAVPLSVSLRSGLTAIPREKFIYLSVGFSSNFLLPAFPKILVTSGSCNYRTQHKSGRLFNYTSINDDLGVGDNVMIYCGPTNDELKNPKEEDVEASNKLIYHLNANLEFYHKMIWLYITPERRFMLLDGINLYVEDEQRMRSIASVVNNKLMGIVGNSMVFQVIPGLNLNPDFKQGIANEKTGQLVPLIDYYQHAPLDPLRVSVPTKGVFAEAMMGKCNSCEKKDETRFWRWEESPIPDSPTSISPIVAPTPTVTQPNLQPTPFANPIVNIQNAPTAPDSSGLSGVLNSLGKSDTFNDVTGLSANQANAIAGLQTTAAAAQNFASMGLAKNLASQVHNTQNTDKILDNIRNAPELSDSDKAGLIKEHLQQQIDGGQSNQVMQQNQQNAKPSLADVAKSAAEQGRAVKASTTDSSGKSESVDISSGTSASFRVPGNVPLVLQGSKTNACWAAAATMMKSWKDQKQYTIPDVLATVPAEYLEKFNNNVLLLSSEKADLIQSLDMVGEAPASYTFNTYIGWLKQYGPIWVTVDGDTTINQISPHAKVLIGYNGDGTEPNSKLVFLDPASNGEQQETFEDFLDEYEQMVTDNPGSLFIQVVHYADEIIGEGKTSFPKISGGTFGIVFNDFITNIHDPIAVIDIFPPTIIKLLKRSGTFNSNIKILDTKYAPYNADFLYTDGVFTEGPNKGKRIIGINSWTDGGSSFSPLGSVGNENASSDGITFEFPQKSDPTSDQYIGDWIALIAHETTHCFRFVTNKNDYGTTLPENINAEINDEKQVRITEEKIVAEATLGNALPGYKPKQQGLTEDLIQRDIFPGKLRRTYLEEFVLSALQSQAIKIESLTDDAITTFNTKVDALPMGQWLIEIGHIVIVNADGIHEPFPIASDYAELQYYRRIIAKDWDDLIKTIQSPPTPDDLQKEEDLLQKHATDFFRGVTSYSPII